MRWRDGATVTVTTVTTVPVTVSLTVPVTRYPTVVLGKCTIFGWQSGFDLPRPAAAFRARVHRMSARLTASQRARWSAAKRHGIHEDEIDLLRVAELTRRRGRGERTATRESSDDESISCELRK